MIGDAESVARLFHETYERLAPGFGYQTRPDSAVGWEQVPEANRRLMVATAAEVLTRLGLGGPPDGRLRLVLRSGAEVHADLTLTVGVDGADGADGRELPKVTEDPQTQRLTGLVWRDRVGAEQRLLYVDPDEVAAAVLVTDPAVDAPADAPTGGAGEAMGDR